MKGEDKSFGTLAPSGDYSDDQTIPVNGKDYNQAGSTLVGMVKIVQTLSNAHSLPVGSVPNSVMRNFIDGKLHMERYFGYNGKPYLDIDYTCHGNPKMHPDVPHQHIITFDGEKMKRSKSDGRIK